MDANALIDAYAQAVLRHVPRRKRKGVGVELRDRLTRALMERAAATNRTADDAMTIEMLEAFGTPSAVAARYHRPWAIIDPADTRVFLLTAAIALVAIVFARATGFSGRYHDAGPLWLFGLLVVVFGVRSLARWAFPDDAAWRPRAPADPDRADRAANVTAIVVIIAAIGLYANPTFVLDQAIRGFGPPIDFSYTDGFRDPARMRLFGLFGLMSAYAALLAVVAVQGRWRRSTRGLEILLLVALGLWLVWNAWLGEIFVMGGIDAVARRALAFGAAILLIDAAIKMIRAWGRARTAPKSPHPT